MALTSDSRSVAGTTSFGEQVRQVAIIYTSQRLLLWFGGLFSVFFVPLLIAAALDGKGATNQSPAMAFLVGMPLMWSLIFLVGQAKSQFAHARARVMPGFLPAHLTVLVAILFLLFVGIPGIVAAASGASLLSLVAVAMAIGAPALWGGHLNRAIPTFVSLGAFYTLLSGWGQRFWITEAAIYRPVHAGIAVIGTALVAAWLWRLCHITEEMDDYQNVFQAMMARRTNREAIEQRRIVAMQMRRTWLMGYISDWWADRVGGYYGGGRNGLERLVRYGFNAVPIEVQGFIFAAMALGMTLLFMQFNFFREGPASFGAVFFAAQFGILMPGQLAGEFMAQRRPRMANELLLPASRTQLVDALMSVSVQNAAKLWLIMHVTLALALAIAERPVGMRMAVVFVLLSAAVTCAAVGVGLRLSVWTSMAKRMLVSLLAWLVLIPALVVWVTAGARLSAWPFVVVAAVFVAVGVWGILAARRAWLDLEFV